jgi:hypothetical protein
MEVTGQLHDFTLRGKTSSIHWRGGYVGPRAGLDMVMKRKILSPCWELNPSCPACILLTKLTLCADKITGDNHYGY